MKLHCGWCGLLAGAMVVVFSAGASTGRPNSSQHRVEKARGEVEMVADAGALRAEGPRGLARLIEANASRLSEIKRLASVGAELGESDQELLNLIDTVAAQKDAAWSGLYWYTSLEEAKAAAAAERKPILSLRLLGNLTDEFSCANSRFFRAVLYSNSAISACLRDRFVLHWSSERAVPKITIDYGDGRQIRRTITGNSIHYVLTPAGVVVDAIPGLNSPSSFLGQIERCARHRELWSGGAGRAVEIAYINETRAMLRSELDTGVAVPMIAPMAPVAAPNAAKAGAISISKLGGEYRDLKALRLEPRSPDVRRLFSESMTQGMKEGMDESSRSLLMAHLRSSADHRDDAKVDDAYKAFMTSMMADTVVNQRSLRPMIIDHLAASAETGMTLDQINPWVYERVFLTPRSDPWLGLLNDDVYDGLRRSESVIMGESRRAAASSIAVSNR